MASAYQGHVSSAVVIEPSSVSRSSLMYLPYLVSLLPVLLFLCNFTYTK